MTQEKNEQSNKAIIEINRFIPHSIDRVWAALTDKDQMKQWYFDLDQFKPEKGFIFKFAGKGHKGENYNHVCEILECKEPHVLSYSWTYEGYAGYSVLKFELSSVENGTQLRLTHTGLDSFPKNNPDFAIESFNGGWSMLIGQLLPEYLDKME